MRYAVADTGSNTIRLGVYDDENGQLKQLCNTAVLPTWQDLFTTEF